LIELSSTSKEEPQTGSCPVEVLGLAYVQSQLDENPDGAYMKKKEGRE
jgi:hypothetical protein